MISIGEGMAASTSEEDMDAMFQPRPHGVIAVDPLPPMHISVGTKSTLRPNVAGGLSQQANLERSQYLGELSPPLESQMPKTNS